MGIDPYTSILITAWTLGGVAVLLTAGRFVIRLRMHRSLMWDDLTHLIAMLSMIAFDVVETINFPLEIRIAAFGAGKGPEPSEADLDMYFRTAVAGQFTFWPAVYGVKLSFLLFYFQIFNISRPFMIAWKIVLGYIVLTFLASFLSAFWGCGSPSDLFVVSSCLSPQAAKNVNTYSETLVALNILGDLAIMALPLAMLQKLRMRSSQKAGLACVFLLGFVTIFCDIARITVGGNGNGLKLAPLWDVLEPTLGVIISTLPTYRGLLLPSTRRTTTSYRDGRPSGTPGSGGKSGRSYELSKPRRGTNFSQDSTHSAERLNVIVTKDIHVVGTQEVYERPDDFHGVHAIGAPGFRTDDRV